MFESVSRQEIYRYLGYRGNQPDAAVCALVEDCLAEVDRAAVPRQVSARVPVRAEGDTVLLGELPVESRALAKHLRDCPEAFLFAATLGPGVDQLLRRYGRLQVSRAAVIQAVSAAVIEDWCDRCQQALADGLGPGWSLRSRFSPGYGDLPLAFQRPLLDTLQADRRIGIGLTDTLLMTPSKSVSAIIGIRCGETETSGKCAGCGSISCPYRQENRGGNE